MATKKKGGRYTAPKEPLCLIRSSYLRKRSPHSYTSRNRKRIKGTEEWQPWQYTCAGCGKKKP